MVRLLIPVVVVGLVVGLLYVRVHYKSWKKRQSLEIEKEENRTRREESEWIDKQLRKDL